LAEREPVCEVCGAALASTDILRGRREGRPLCRRPDCQLLAAQLDGMDPAARAAHGAIRGALIRARRERETHADRDAASAAEEEARVDRDILERARGAAGPLARVAALPIPSGLRTVAALPAKRRERYRRHLERTIHEALRAPEGAVARDRDNTARKRATASERFLGKRPALATRCRQACELCKGGCCVTGGDHAFISTATIRRLVDADPELDPGEILDTYLSHLPERTIQGACVNQTATGCSLPRAWRSDSCNAYFCESLTAFQREWDEARPPDAVVMIRRARTNAHRATPGTVEPVAEVVWVSDDGMRRLDPAD